MQSTLTDSTLRIIFDGDLLSTNVDALRQKIITIIGSNPGATTVVADLKNARLVDSRGVNLLIALYRETQTRKFGFSAENPSADVHRLLAMLNLEERFGLKNKA